MTDLAGRTAVVSGASRGIGLEVARAFAQDGVRVALLARSEDELRARAAELGAGAVAIVCDVSDAAAISRASEQATDAFGGAPDILVNNAGVFDLAAIERTTADDFRRSIDVNLVAPFLLIHAFLGAMCERRSGHIVNIGSVADRNTFPENGAYAAAKFGLRAMHEVLRAELRGTGVRATLVSPSAVDTPLWDQHEPDSRAGFTPRRKMLRAADVAAAVRFAVSQPPSVNVDELRLSHS